MYVHVCIDRFHSSLIKYKYSKEYGIS